MFPAKAERGSAAMNRDYSKVYLKYIFYHYIITPRCNYHVDVFVVEATEVKADCQPAVPGGSGEVSSWRGSPFGVDFELCNLTDVLHGQQNTTTH